MRLLILPQAMRLIHGLIKGPIGLHGNLEFSSCVIQLRRKEEFSTQWLLRRNKLMSLPRLSRQFQGGRSWCVSIRYSETTNVLVTVIVLYALIELMPTLRFL